MAYCRTAWPAWILEEDVILVYFCCLGFEIPDVALIMADKLHRRIRSRDACMTRMDKLNEHQAQRYLPPLCTSGMADWDRAVVEHFLINSISDAHLLGDLLSFHTEYIPLLRTVRPDIEPFENSFADGAIVAGQSRTSRSSLQLSKLAMRAG